MIPVIILVLILTWITTLLYLLVRHNHKQKALLDNLLAEQYDSLVRCRTSLEELHMLQHDMQNHFLTIRSLAKRGETELALEQVEQLRVLIANEAEKCDTEGGAL